MLEKDTIYTIKPCAVVSHCKNERKPRTFISSSSSLFDTYSILNWHMQSTPFSLTHSLTNFIVLDFKFLPSPFIVCLVSFFSSLLVCMARLNNQNRLRILLFSTEEEKKSKSIKYVPLHWIQNIYVFVGNIFPFLFLAHWRCDISDCISTSNIKRMVSH